MIIIMMDMKPFKWKQSSNYKERINSDRMSNTSTNDKVL